MTTQEVANHLVDLCRKGEYDQVYQELYSPQIESIEPEGSTWETKVIGMEAIRKKGQQWHEMIENVLASEISDPIVAENYFSLTMKTRVKIKDMPEPYDMDEICVYRVEDGKIVSEQFFYTPMPQLA